MSVDRPFILPAIILKILLSLESGMLPHPVSRWVSFCSYSVVVMLSCFVQSSIVFIFLGVKFSLGFFLCLFLCSEICDLLAWYWCSVVNRVGLVWCSWCLGEYVLGDRCVG